MAGPNPVVEAPDPTRLVLTATHADGTTTRWAEDEPEAANVFEGLTIGTALPGGDKTLSLTLPRLPHQTHDLARFDRIECEGPGGLEAFGGYQSEFPAQTGEQSTVQVEAVGWAGSLLWNSAFMEIYVDRDLTAWGPMSRLQRVFHGVTNSRSVFDGEVRPDAGGMPELRIACTGEWYNIPHAIALYDCGPGGWGSLYFDYVSNDTGSDPWHFAIREDTDADPATGEDVAYDDSNVGSVAQYVNAYSGKRFISLVLFYQSGSGGANEYEYGVSVRKLAVYGRHGLQKRGTDPGGFYASDVVRHIISQSGAPISIDEENFADTQFAIPHLVFKEPTSPEAAILATNAYELFDWGCVGQRFFFRPPTVFRKQWRVRLSEGATLDLVGEQAEETFSGVVVSYSDFSGESHSVGPPGSGAEVEDTSLQITDPTNPVVAHGFKKIGLLEVGVMTSLDGAKRLGQVWLERTQIPSHRGEITAAGLIRDSSGNPFPAWYVKAGDSVTVEDEGPEETHVVERRIVETGYAHTDRRVSMSVDSLPSRLDAIMAQMEAVLVGQT